MKKPVATVPLAALVAALAAGCEAESMGEQDGGSGRQNAPPPPSVLVVSPRQVMRAHTEEITGTLMPQKGLSLAFEVGGRLARVRVAKGAKVKAGQVLAELDTEIADAQVAQAEAGRAVAEAGFGLASEVAQRNERLMSQGSVSEMQSRSAVTSSHQAQAQLLSAKATLAQARAARRKHELRAPFDATVIGAPEQPGATVAPGVPLFVLEKVDALLFQGTLSETARSRVRVGDKVRVSSVAGQGFTGEATVRTIVPSADATTRRIPVDIIVPNEDGRFVAHTLARAVLTLGDPAVAHALPSTALSSSGGYHVYVVAEGGVARRMPVDVLDRGAAEVIVRAERPLERVINHPDSTVADGLPVTVQ